MSAQGDRSARRFLGWKFGLAISLAALSAAASLTGMLILTASDNTPGAVSAVPRTWPGGSRIERSRSRRELIVFVHPFCGCTEATISELAKLPPLNPAYPDAPAITFAVFRPGRESGWKWTALARSTAALPGAKLRWDDGGVEARRFGAVVSGFVLLYSSENVLMFHGGVTGSRGHEGDNYGLDALRDALKTPPGRAGAGYTTRGSRTFGCALGSFGADPIANPLAATGGAPDRSARAAGRGAKERRNPPVQPRFGGHDLRVFLGRTGAQ